VCTLGIDAPSLIIEKIEQRLRENPRIALLLDIELMILVIA
jgi:hypothetical protein